MDKIALVVLTTWLMGISSEGAEEIQRIDTEVPYRELTQPPHSHWFGYYDKYQFDPSGRYLLGMEVDFDTRAPQADDVIRLGVIDLQDGDRWRPFGETHAWCWQQGCMLQWVPGSSQEVIYNDRRDGKFVAVIHNIVTGQLRVVDRPIYTVSPNGRQALSLNFARLDSTRPGYGYTGVAYDWAGRECPADEGIELVDLETGEVQLIVTLADTIEVAPNESMQGVRHWFNHLLFNPDGTRFIFLHRWNKQTDGKGGWYTRMLTADTDGGHVHVVADHGMVSHFIWRNPSQILTWSTEPETGNRFHLYTDRTDRVEAIGEGVLNLDGHCTYSPDGQWIVTDTYPDQDRMQHLMLYRPSDGRLLPLGQFYMPPELQGSMRCDLHPRWSRDGRSLCIDSAHSGRRQMILLDIGTLLDQQ